MKIRVRLLDVVVEIHTDHDEAAALLSLLWAPMRSEDGDPPARTYRVDRDGTGWVATAGERVEATHESLWGVTDALRYAMLELSEERLRRYVTLHAAAVAREGRLVVLAGESGAGKTTLTLALLDAGWTYFSDDLAPVAIDSALVHPFPKPLGIKDASAWEGVRDAFVETPLGPPEGSFLVPSSRWDVATEPLPVSALLFPRFSAGAALGVERLSAAKAAAVVSAYLRRLDPETVGLLNKVCAGATCARLVYGSTADAFRAIEDVLNHRE